LTVPNHDLLAKVARQFEKITEEYSLVAIKIPSEPILIGLTKRLRKSEEVGEVDVQVQVRVTGKRNNHFLLEIVASDTIAVAVQMVAEIIRDSFGSEDRHVTAFWKHMLPEYKTSGVGCRIPRH